jgi:hypothetical protein
MVGGRTLGYHIQRRCHRAIDRRFLATAAGNYENKKKWKTEQGLGEWILSRSPIAHAALSSATRGSDRGTLNLHVVKREVIHLALLKVRPLRAKGLSN